LNENEQNARDLAHYSDRERSLTLYNQWSVIEKSLHLSLQKIFIYF
jgi:hypothetical protein